MSYNDMSPLAVPPQGGFLNFPGVVPQSSSDLSEYRHFADATSFHIKICGFDGYVFDEA